MSQRKRFLAPLTAVASALILAGCAGSGGSSLSNGDGSSSGAGDNDSGAEQTAQGASTATSGTGETVSTAGEEMKAMDMPVGGEVTSGTGEVLIASSDMFDAFAEGLDEGVGNYRQNDNFLGTTFAAGSKGLGESGDVVVASGEMIESMNGMPVFMQVDESSGAVTALGGTVSDLGVKVTDAGDRFAAEFSDDTTIGKGTAQLSAVVQPVMMQTEDGIGYVGDALLIGPVASEMLDRSAALFIKGAGVVGAADPRLSGPEKMMTGGAQMVSGGGKLLTAGGEPGDPPGFDSLKPGDIDGMKAGLGPVGDSVSMLGGAISQVETPVGGEVTSGTGEVLVQAGASISALDFSGSGQLAGALDGSASISNVLQAPIEQLSDTLTAGQLDASGLEGATASSDDQDTSLSGATDGIEDVVDDGQESLSRVVGGLTGGSL